MFNIFGFHCAILTLDAKGFATLPAQSLRSLIVIVLHDCNSVLIQTVIVFFHR